MNRHANKDTSRGEEINYSEANFNARHVSFKLIYGLKIRSVAFSFIITMS